MKAAGYNNGEPLRILSPAASMASSITRWRRWRRNIWNLPASAVDMQVVDWATLTQRRADPQLWDIYITHSPFPPEPALIGSLSTSSPGWWDTPRPSGGGRCVHGGSCSPDKRVALFADVQKAIYDDVAWHEDRLGSNARSRPSRPGLKASILAPWPYFWNASIAK